MASHYIVMGDIIQSSAFDAKALRKEFMRLIDLCNSTRADDILSPYTITLGDEFQGVARSLRGVVETIFFLEEQGFQEGLQFKMRYVTVHGPIDTDINPAKAHGMMGAGLTRARALLSNKGRGEARFRFDLPDVYTSQQLNRLFLVIDGIAGRWDSADAALILDMLSDTNNAEVGEKHGKNRSQIWKRRKHLQVEEYRALKEAVIDLIDCQRET